MPKPKIKPQPNAQPTAPATAQWPAASAGSLPSLPGAAGPWAIMPEALKALEMRMAQPMPEGAAWWDDGPQPQERPYELRGDVAVVNVRGTLTKRGSWWTTGMDGVQAAIQAALEDPSVRAVLLSVDSPGSSVDGIRELSGWLAARVADSGKLFACYADGTMCSGAYWLGGATGRVFAPSTALVGSIGVISRHVDWSACLAKEGIAVTYITSGSRKAAGASELPLSESDRAYFQHLSDTAYVQFLDDVATRMGLDRAAPAAWADGQVFRATEALSLGLVTAIVPDIAGAVAAISQEVHMDAKELAAKHPDAAAEIRREAETATRETMGKEQATAVEGARNAVLDMVAAICGEESAAKVRELLASGVSAAQMAALSKAGLLAAPGGNAAAQPQQPEQAQGTTAQERILSGLLESASATPMKPGATGQSRAQGGAEDRCAALVEQSKQIAKR